MKKLLPLIVLVVMGAMLMISWGNIADLKTEDAEKYSVLMKKGEAYEEKRIYIDAVKQFDSALKLKPSYDLAMRTANLYKELKNDKKYISTLETAVSCDKKNPEPYMALIEAYEKQGSAPKLYKMLNRAKDALSDSDRLTEEQSYKINSMLKSMLSEIKIFSFPYDEFYGFHKYEGTGKTYAKAGLEGQYGLLDSKLNGVTSFQYEDIGFMNESLLPLCKNGEYYCNDESGNRKIVPNEQATALGAFGSGVAPLQVDGKYGYIDTKMNESHFDYEFAGSFERGIAPVKQNGKWFVINRQFEAVGPNFDEILVDAYGFCSPYGVYFGKSGNSWGMYNTAGEKIADGFEEVRQFASKQPAAVKKDGKWCFVALSGEIILETSFEDANSFSIDYAPVQKGGLWGCIDQEGNILVDPQFEILGPFSEEGYAIGENAKGICSVYIRQYK